MHFTPLLVLGAAAATVSAAPVEAPSNAKVISVPLKHVSNVKSAKNIVAKGQQRLLKYNGAVRPTADASSGSVTNEDYTYVAPVNIGGKTWSLIVDTGSSNTWCGAQTSCEQTNSGQDTKNSVQVSYGSGYFFGEEYTDNVEFGGLTVKGQSIGAASQASGFSGVDGIIGFGPVDLTQGTVSNTEEVPTFMDNLYSQGSISEEVLGVSFRPESGDDSDDTNGELTLGGTDSSKYSGSINYFPQLQSGDAAAYWGISISNFKYGSKTLSGSAQGIVDTGTTLIYIPTSAYNAFLSATGGSTDPYSGLSSFPSAPTQDFYITFGSKSFPLTPSQYLVPQDQYNIFGLSSGTYYSWIIGGGNSGVDTIVGQKFLENYYAVFDTTNSRIGFAPGV